MNERSMRRSQGAPFYAPPRRKTSAEIISEARAAIYGDSASPESNANGGSGALRPLRTRRPFTPRDPQRTLFGDRSRRKEPRPPSAFNLKYLSLSESSEDAANLPVPSAAKVSSLDETNFHGVLLTEPQVAKKKSMLSSKIQSQDTSWAGFPKLPHLNGHSKPLHKRRNEQPTDGSKSDSQLASAISITQPLHTTDNAGPTNTQSSKSNSAGSANVKRRQFVGTKSLSDANTSKNQSMGDIGVKHLAVQIPNTSGHSNYDSMTTLELAEALSQRIGRSVERTLMLLEALQVAIEKVSPATSLRDFVLRSLYIYVDNDDERVIVAISRIMLTMRVTGAHLAVACKLVFKVARNDKNDHFFRSTNLLELLVEGCGRACPLTEGECTVYGAGALRFLALEPRLRILALKAGALHLAALHLKILNNAKAENPRSVSEQSTHALYQLTGALRNLAGGNSSLSAFVASGALAELLTSLQLFLTDRDVLTNLVRCLSVLSADEACCAWLCAASNSASSLLTALATCAARAPLAVRLAYTLGNMAAAEEHARLNIYNEEGSIDVLLTILESYTQRTDKDTRDLDMDPDLHLVGSDLGGSDGSCEDVLIKTVRVVANVCLCEKAGRGLAALHAERTIQALLACIKLASPNKNYKKHLRMQSDLELDTEEERREELATASLATLNNITFYREPSIPSDPLDLLLDDLCRVTCKWLPIHKGCEEAACEAVRALGNLSRSPRAANIIVREGALDALTQILQHDDAAVRYAGAGVLVNICGAGGGDAATGATIDALSRAAMRGDASTAALLARALWNAQAHAPLDSTHAYQAETALAHFIDDESVFSACEAPKTSDRRSSEADLSKHQVRFDMANNNHSNMEGNYLEQQRPGMLKAFSADQDLNIDNSGDENDRTACSGEDLGFEDGDAIGDDFCNCSPCRRLAAWEELVGVAIPLLEKLRPARADASVGTD